VSWLQSSSSSSPSSSPPSSLERFDFFFSTRGDAGAPSCGLQ
jgi:hypothetical protein